MLVPQTIRVWIQRWITSSGTDAIMGRCDTFLTVIQFSVSSGQAAHAANQHQKHSLDDESAVPHVPIRVQKLSSSDDITKRCFFLRNGGNKGPKGNCFYEALAQSLYSTCSDFEAKGKEIRQLIGRSLFNKEVIAMLASGNDEAWLQHVHLDICRRRDYRNADMSQGQIGKFVCTDNVSAGTTEMAVASVVYRLHIYLHHACA